MKTYDHFLFAIRLLAAVIFTIPATSQIMAQKKPSITNIDFEIQGDQMVITYDIINASPGQTFTVELTILTGSGKTIPAKTLGGDVFRNVKGGNNKRIFWDLKKDNVVIDDAIQVQLVAIPEDVSPAGQQIPRSEKPSFSTGNVMLRSVLWPGLGNQKINGGGAWWLLGVAGYTSLAGSWLLNLGASSAYDDYLNATTSTDRDSYFKTARLSYNLSKALGYTAVGIWLTDFTITAIRASAGKKPAKVSQSGLQLHSNFDATMQSPTLGIVYKF